MSDLSLQLQQAASQLPVSAYVDPALFRREMETLFARGPRYVGHARSVPSHGDYYALPNVIPFQYNPETLTRWREGLGWVW